jgi:hypothetical protein
LIFTPRIGERVESQFLLGEYELAAFAAMREVEIRMRELVGETESLLGVKLMNAAFGRGGALRNANLDAGEQEGRTRSSVVPLRFQEPVQPPLGQFR